MIAYFTTKQILFFNQSKNLNLILISVDTLRPDHMGIYGYNKNTTPNIDRWAKNALVFTNTFTVDPVTFPSFTALLAGLTPFSSKIINNIVASKYIPPIYSNTKTLAKILKQNNYVTGGFNTNAHLSSYFTNLGEGFDEYNLLDTDNNKDYFPFVEKANSFIKTNKDKKLFLWLHLFNPHYPYRPPQEYRCTFNKKYCDILSPASDEDIEALETKRKQYEGWESSDKPSPTQEEIEIYKTLYDGEIAYTDSLIKSVFDTLKQEGLEKNSLVILYGDHGEGFDHNYLFAHGAHLYNSSVKIPLIIKSPQYAKVGKTGLLIENSDIFTTILNLLGINSDQLEQDGQSFIGLFNNQSTIKNRKYVYFVNQDGSKYAISDGNYKYIFSLDKTCHNTCWENPKAEEFYNIKTDPEEKIDLFEEKKDVSFELKNRLFNYLSHYNLPPITSTKVEDKSKTQNYQDNLEKLRSLGY